MADRAASASCQATSTANSTAPLLLIHHRFDLSHLFASQHFASNVFLSNFHFVCFQISFEPSFAPGDIGENDRLHLSDSGDEQQEPDDSAMQVLSNDNLHDEIERRMEDDLLAMTAGDLEEIDRAATLEDLSPL